MKFPVAADKGDMFDTVLSNVLTSATPYSHPPLKVLNVPVGATAAVPVLIQIRFGLSNVNWLIPVWNVGAVVPLTPVRYGYSVKPLVSMIGVFGSVKFVSGAHTKSVAGPRLIHVN